MHTLEIGPDIWRSQRTQPRVVNECNHPSIWRMSGKIKTWVHVEHQAMQHGYADQTIYEVHQLHTRQQVTAAKESVC